MKFLLLLALAVAVSASGSMYYDVKVSDQDHLLKQKKIFNLLYHVSQPDIINVELYQAGMEYNIAANVDSYAKEANVKGFLEMYTNGVLPRGEIFSVYYQPHLEEAYSLFKLFYYANDFDIFYKTALWAKVHINEGQFVFAVYNAVLRRSDTVYIQLPPPYEMYPYAFFNSEVMEKAHHAKIFGKLDKKSTPETYIIPANYSGWYLQRDYDFESKLNYFTEDIGFNSFYFFMRHDNPFWMSSKEYPLLKNRGEEFLYAHKQILNRYYLERLSNDLAKVEDFDWNSKFYPGYYPTNVFHNGLPVPQRPHWTSFPYYKYKYIKDIQEMETRISAAIDSGYVTDATGKWINIYTPEGLNILGNLIEGNMDSCNMEFYGSLDKFGRKILGFSLEPFGKYQISPSSMEMFTMNLRDPAFYRLYKRIVQYYYKYLSMSKPYSKEEVIYPSLKIENFSVDKLITYFDQFDAMISNGLMVENQKEAESALIKIRQYRLNHKPFSFHFTVNAEKKMDAVVRIFIGPKMDTFKKNFDFEKAMKYFYEIDNFITEVNQGPNKIVRNSQDFYFVSPDPESSDIIYKKVLKSLESSEPYSYQQRVFGFPERLIIPKGKKEGLQFQLFIHIAPVEKSVDYYSRVFGNYKFDSRDYGYPLNKPMRYFPVDAPNMMLKDIVIFHKDDIENLSF